MDPKTFLELPLSNGNIAFVAVESIVLVTSHTVKSSGVYLQGVATQLTVETPAEELMRKLKNMGAVKTP